MFNSDDPAKQAVAYLFVSLIVLIAAMVGFRLIYPETGPDAVQRTPIQQPQSANTTGPDTLDLPDYRVVERVDQMVGGIHGDVILPSVDVQIDTTRMKRIAFAILEREDLDEAGFYVNRSALRANMSKSYREAHPGALEAGYLGSVRKGAFSPSPYLYDPRFQ